MGQILDNYGPNPEPYPIKLERCQKRGDGLEVAIMDKDNSEKVAIGYSYQLEA
jgi:hypothetical protein